MDELLTIFLPYLVTITGITCTTLGFAVFTYGLEQYVAKRVRTGFMLLITVPSLVLLCIGCLALHWHTKHQGSLPLANSLHIPRYDS
jgi:hypothetical protein